MNDLRFSRLLFIMTLVASAGVHVAALGWMGWGERLTKNEPSPTTLYLVVTCPSEALAGARLTAHYRVYPRAAEQDRPGSARVAWSLKHIEDKRDAQAGTAADRELSGEAAQPLRELFDGRDLPIDLPADLARGEWELSVKVELLDDPALDASTGKAEQILEASRRLDVRANGVDLVIAGFDLYPIERKDEAYAADAVESWVRVRSIGGREPADGWVDRLYISAEPRITPTSRMLGEWSRQPGSISQGGYQGVLRWHAALHAPDFMGPQAWLIAVIDIDDRLDDVDRASNVAVMEIYWSRLLSGRGRAGLPNLVVRSFEAPQQAAAGEPLELSWETLNEGETAAVGPWSDAVILERVEKSSDATGEASDAASTRSVILHDQKTHTVTLPVGQRLAVRSTAKLPANMAPGRYRVRVTTDAAVQLRESGREDNTQEQVVEILPAFPEIPLGDDREVESPMVAWLAWDDFQRLVAKQSKAAQPLLENRPAIATSAAQEQMLERLSQATANAATPRSAPRETRGAPQPPVTPNDRPLVPHEHVGTPDASDALQGLRQRGEAEEVLPPFNPKPERKQEIREPINNPAEPQPKTPQEEQTKPALRQGDAARQSDADKVAKPDKPQHDDQPSPPATPAEKQPPRTPNSPAKAEAFLPEPPREDVRPGQVVTQQGIRIVTQHIDQPLSVIMMNLPRPPVIRVQFGLDGRVMNHTLVQSSGISELDSAVISSLYRWRAEGEQLKAQKVPFWREFTILLVR